MCPRSAPDLREGLACTACNAMNAGPVVGAADCAPAEADSRAAAYDSRPSRRQGANRPTSPRRPHLAAPVGVRAQACAVQMVFTTCMPNGMHASLSLVEVDALSDAFAAWLREDAAWRACYARTTVAAAPSLGRPASGRARWRC